MWKKPEQDGAMDARPEFAPKETPDLEARHLEAPGDALLRSLVDSRLKRENLAAGPQSGPQKVLAQDRNQPLPAPTMATYTEALNEFATNATWFIEQLPLLTKARDAYERAMRASAELRKVLDTGEENLQTLMTQLEQAVSVHGAKPAADRKKPEPAKVETIRETDESSGEVRKFS
jgi:exonuclease VII small subunit